jgi:hypothetical protein
MHELSLVMNIIELAEAEAFRAQATAIRAIDLEIGLSLRLRLFTTIVLNARVSWPTLYKERNCGLSPSPYLKSRASCALPVVVEAMELCALMALHCRKDCLSMWLSHPAKACC